jgi:signal transduction histidine kinase
MKAGIECTSHAKREQDWPDREESLATVAHELREPLAAIVFALEAIPDDGDADPATQRIRTNVKRQARRAVQIVEDIFDICAVSRGTLPLRKEVVELAEIVAGATETTRHLLDSRNHQLTVTLPSEPVLLHADPLRLEQVLTNLLANAAKFTDPGGHIWVTAEVDAGQVVVRVRDSGWGIDPDLLPQLFDLFQRGHARAGKNPHGLGLGLALVKSLVARHGGSVAALSDGPGAGSEFIVRLPIWVRERPRQGSQTTPRVLITSPFFQVADRTVDVPPGQGNQLPQFGSP